jgi:hypothetical protein
VVYSVFLRVQGLVIRVLQLLLWFQFSIVVLDWGTSSSVSMNSYVRCFYWKREQNKTGLSWESLSVWWVAIQIWCVVRELWAVSFLVLLCPVMRRCELVQCGTVWPFELLESMLACCWIFSSADLLFPIGSLGYGFSAACVGTIINRWIWTFQIWLLARYLR